MENKEQTLQEQEAPLKNHDNAFVQVGKNGEPVIPEPASPDGKADAAEEENGSNTTLDKR